MCGVFVCGVWTWDGGLRRGGGWKKRKKDEAGFFVWELGVWDRWLIFLFCFFFRER